MSNELTALCCILSFDLLLSFSSVHACTFIHNTIQYNTIQYNTRLITVSADLGTRVSDDTKRLELLRSLHCHLVVLKIFPFFETKYLKNCISRVR